MRFCSHTNNDKCLWECKNSEKMPKRCVVGGRSNTPSLEEGNWQPSSHDAVPGMMPLGTQALSVEKSPGGIYFHQLQTMTNNHKLIQSCSSFRLTHFHSISQ